MAQDKTVKIAIVVDKPSLDLAKTAIEGITNQVKELVKLTKDLGGIFGGGVAKATNTAGQAGTSAATQATHGAGGRSANPFQGMARGAQETGTQIRAFGEITTKTFKSSEEAMRRLVDAQDAQVRRSQGIMERFRRILTGSATGGGGPPAAGGSGGLDSILGQLGGGGAGGGGGGIMGMLGGKSPGFMAAAGRAAPFAALIAAANFGMTSSSSGYLTNLDFQLARPMINTQAGANIGGAFGGQALAYRHGDLARSVSMDEMTRGSVRERAWFDTQMKKAKGELNEKRAAETPITFREHYTKAGGGIGGVYSATKAGIGGGAEMIANYWRANSVGNFFKGMGRLATGGDITDMAALHPDMQARIKNMSISAAAEKEMQNKILEQHIQKNPLRAELFNQMYAGSLSDLSMARGAGFGGGLTLNRRTGQLEDSVQNFRQRALNMNRAEGELIGAMQGMGSIAGQGFF